MTPRERLEALRQEQGAIEGIATPRQKLNTLRAKQGDSDGSGQGSTPSNNPVFEAARKSGFLTGYLDQAAGINQILDRFKQPDVERTKRELQGFENVPVFSIDDVIEQREKEYQRTRKEKGLTGFDWARLAGNLSSPVSMATMKMPVGSTIPTKIAAGGAAGGVAGLAQPVLSTEGDFKSQKAFQGTLGVGVGAIAQPVISSIKGVVDFGKYIARPFNKSGQMKDVAELYVKLAGQSKNKIIKALDDAKTHIPSNRPTAGQAIAEGTMKMRSAANLTAEEMIEGVKNGRFIDDGLPENFGSAIVKFEKELHKLGTSGDELKTVLTQQAARRKNAIAGIIDQSEDSLQKAIAKRTAETKPFYDAVENSTKSVRVGNVVSKVNELIKKNVNEDNVVSPMRAILGKLKSDGLIETSPQNLYSLSRQIKTMIQAKTPGGTNEFNVKALSEVKTLLDKQIGKAEPAFAKAQYLFKKHSEPIDQIMVAREFGDALENSLVTGEERALPFTNAMNNAVKVLKKSTGFARYKNLSDVMNPKQIAVLKKVQEELKREAKAKRMATDTGTVVKQLSEGIEISLPNMLSRPMMLANAVLRKIGKDMSPAYEALAIKIQKDPKLLSYLLKQSEISKERKMVIELLTRYSEMIPAQELSRNELTEEN